MPTFVFGEYDPELVFHNDRHIGIVCKIVALDLLGAVKCLLDRFEDIMDDRDWYHLYCLFPSMFDYDGEDGEIEEEYLKERIEWGKTHLTEVLADVRNTDQDRCTGAFLAEDSIIFAMMGEFASGYEDAPAF